LKHWLTVERQQELLLAHSLSAACSQYNGGYHDV
jgi:hypothetical protein